MAFISAKRHHTASGTLQNGSFSKGWANWWKCWISRQSKETCFACAEGPWGQTSIDAFEFAAERGSSAKFPALPVGDAGKVRMGGYAPTLSVGDAGKVRMGGYAPTLPVGNAGKVRMGGYAPTLPVGDAGKVRMGGSLFLRRGGDRSGVEWHGS